MSSDNTWQLKKAPKQTFLLIFDSGIEPEVRDLIRKQKGEWESVLQHLPRYLERAPE